MFSDPQKNVEQFQIAEGAMVADLGVGAGHYARALAKKVGPNGKVFAIDVRKEMVEKFQKEATEEHIKNVEVIWGDIEVVGGTRLRKNAADVVMVANVLFLVDAKPGIVHEISRILKPGGKLCVVDWSESFGGLGPPTELVVDAQAARRLFESGPFKYSKDIEAGSHHYGMIFQKTNDLEG